MKMLATAMIWMDEHKTVSALHQPQWRRYVTCKTAARARVPCEARGPGGGTKIEPGWNVIIPRTYIAK